MFKCLLRHASAVLLLLKYFPHPGNGCSVNLFSSPSTIIIFDVISAHVCTYNGRLCFHRCVSVQGWSPVSDFWGGTQSQIFRGVPSLRFSTGGYPVSDFKVREYPVSDFWGEGYLVSDFQGSRGYPVSVKLKIFDTIFGLIHVQTGKKIFLSRDPFPSKGKTF